MGALKIVETYRENSGDVIQATSYFECRDLHNLRDSLKYYKSRKRKSGETYYYSIRKVKEARPFKIQIIRNQTKI